MKGFFPPKVIELSNFTKFADALIKSKILSSQHEFLVLRD